MPAVKLCGSTLACGKKSRNVGPAHIAEVGVAYLPVDTPPPLHPPAQQLHHTVARQSTPAHAVSDTGTNILYMQYRVHAVSDTGTNILYMYMYICSVILLVVQTFVSSLQSCKTFD